MELDYPTRTEPRPYQLEIVQRTRYEQAHALFLEQRLGKSKVTVDTATNLYRAEKIGGVLVLAPNGVHRAWVSGDADLGDDPGGYFGQHLPEDLDRRLAYWSAGERKHERQAREALYEDALGLRVLAVNVEGLRPSKRRKSGSRSLEEAKRFLRAFRCLLVMDESTLVKNVQAQRTKAVLEIAKLAPYRRILTGEPMPEGPQDLYAQLRVLDDAPLGHRSFFTFRNEFCKVEQRRFPHPSKPNAEVKAEVITGARNEDELRRRLSMVATTLRREDVGAEPPSTVTNRPVDLTQGQRKQYRRLVDEWCYELDRAGEDEPVDVTSALTRLLRLQQLTGGYLSDEDGNVHRIVEPEHNPKLQALLEELGELPPDRKAVVWCRFRAELADVPAALRKAFGPGSVVEYHGGIGGDERERAVASFEHGDARFFIANPAAGRYGLTLAAADDTVWYSWGASYEDYDQACDRVVLPGKERPLHYTHLVAQGTVDAKLLAALRRKEDLAKRVRSSAELKSMLK